ncbi:MAG TPA: phosphoribosylanthranilate isomerase [Nevskiaceae bacterium]|nr:phosphoribosylanthranilate isomerase [Nevskiaceae bacterium]
MQRTRIKFCGFTDADDLAAAVRLGVDAVGFVCVPGSKRYVTPETAAVLRRQVPPFVSTVLLLSNATESAARYAVATVNPDFVQFHGRESAAFCDGLGKPYLKAVGVGSRADIEAAAEAFPKATALLLDSHRDDGMGGTGQAFDWSIVPRDVGWALVLAGGLSPANAGLAVRMAAPYALDVSSGIEATPGRKDPEKMRAFVEAVRVADEWMHANSR